MKGLNGGGCIPRPTACLSAATWNTLRSSFERCTQTERISMAAKNDVGQARTLRQAMWHPCMYICICNYIACICAQINSNQKIITYIYIWSGPQGQFALLWGASHIRSQNSQYAEMLQIWAIKKSVPQRTSALFNVSLHSFIEVTQEYNTFASTDLQYTWKQEKKLEKTKKMEKKKRKTILRGSWWREPTLWRLWNNTFLSWILLVFVVVFWFSRGFLFWSLWAFWLWSCKHFFQNFPYLILGSSVLYK